MSLDKILNELIAKSFRELLNENVKIEWKKLDDALLGYGRLPRHGYAIYVDHSLNDASNGTLVGGIAHELSRIIEEKRIGKRKTFFDWIAYKLSSTYKTLDERNIDLQQILRGYGNELLDFLNYGEEKGFNYVEGDGLTIGEIKLLLTRVYKND